MKFFGSRLPRIVLFLLIFLGQVHSFAYLYSHREEGPPTGKKTSGDLLICGPGWQETLAEKPFPTKSRAEVFSLRSEPFLPSFVIGVLPHFRRSLVFEASSRLVYFIPPPETPPPRV